MDKTMGRLSLLLLIICSLFSQSKADLEWIGSLPKPYLLSEQEVSAILPQFHSRFPEFYDRLKAFAIWRIGTPYSIFKLGEEKEPDTDPLIRLDVSDCTGHVLTSLACVESNSWNEARAKMIDIHYKSNDQGQKAPDYKYRWHYTSDRITNNPYTVDITKELLPSQNLTEVDIILNQQSDSTEFLALDWESELVTHFIPNSEINSDLLTKIPDICGVAFVKRSYWKKGILIAHEGMIINNADIIHASSEYGETVRLPFLKYYFRESGPLFDGIMIYRFVETD